MNSYYYYGVLCLYTVSVMLITIDILQWILFKNKVKYKNRGPGMEGDGGMGMGYLIHITKKHNNPV